MKRRPVCKDVAGDEGGGAMMMAGRFSGPIVALSGLACLALFAVAGVGCADPAGPVVEIHDPVELNRLVSQSSQPVLVDFYKEGCENCLAFDPKLRQLSGQYAGRVVVAKFLLMQAKGVATSPAVAERYDISFYPTVILFVGGAPRKTFVMNYKVADYCAAIDGQLRKSPSAQRGDR
jgi:thiol-disulfide isomerase/thioredoxin